MSHMALYVHLQTFTVFLQYFSMYVVNMGGEKENRGEEWGRREGGGGRR